MLKIFIRKHGQTWYSFMKDSLIFGTSKLYEVLVIVPVKPKAYKIIY